MKNILKWIPIGAMAIILSLIVPAIWFGATIVPTAISHDILVNDKYTKNVENLNDAYYIDTKNNEVKLNSLVELGDYLQPKAPEKDLPWNKPEENIDTAVNVYITDDSILTWSKLWGSQKDSMYKHALRANVWNLKTEERQTFMKQIQNFTNPVNKATRTVKFFVQTTDRKFQRKIMDIKSTGDGSTDNDIEFLNDSTRFEDKYKSKRLDLIGFSVAYIIEIIIFLIILIGIFGMIITFFLG